MKRFQTIALASVGFMATAGQVMLSLACTVPDARERLVSVFRSIYGGMPLWTELMLGWGKLVWLFPAICAVLLLLGLRQRPKVSLSGATAVALIALAGIFYAVYPIHLMLKGGVI